MANYPSVPSNRLALDGDGTIFLKADPSNTITSLTAGDATAVMNENDDSAVFVNSGSWGRFIAIFPRTLDISGLFIQTLYYDVNGGGSWQTPAVEWSPDTTTGLDGTWSTVSGVTNRHFNVSGAVSPGYRNAISSVSLTGVKAIRVNANAGYYSGLGMQAFHVYGRPSSTSFDHLEFWDDSGVARLSGSYLDWQDVARNTTATKIFKVKNMSGSLTAQSVVLSFETLTDTTPTFSGTHTFSTDNVTYTSTLSLGNLAPGALSPVIYVKKTTPSNAVLGLAAGRIKANISGWV